MVFFTFFERLLREKLVVVKLERALRGESVTVDLTTLLERAQFVEPEDYDKWLLEQYTRLEKESELEEQLNPKKDNHTLRHFQLN